MSELEEEILALTNAELYVSFPHIFTHYPFDKCIDNKNNYRIFHLDHGSVQHEYLHKSSVKNFTNHLQEYLDSVYDIEHKIYFS